MTDWDALCATAAPANPNHWAFVHLACAANHLAAALGMAGVRPSEHTNETTVPNEARANLQEVWCAWRNVQTMIAEIGKQARAAENGGADT